LVLRLLFGIRVFQKKKEIIWSGVANGNIKVIIGARSSLFLPFKKLGLIIVDEEHDQSYKQDEGIIYNARDMAVSRASFENIPVNLITAVPSIETYENIKKGKYSISRMEQRYQNASLPKYEIINLNETKLEKQSWLSRKIVDKVKSHLQKNDQVLFFLNRRGFSPHVMCNKCFNSYCCPNCSVNLVYHKKKNNLLCHYCGFKSSLKRTCIKDGDCESIFSGPGVERISDEVKKKFSSKKIEIFSSDTMSKKDSSVKLDKIINNEVQILIGTQLISKGFHFPSLNCIVVVDIDLSLQGHDLRGAEKNLQLYHQLSGRAGRTGKPATVYFQTYNTNTKMISDLTNSNPNIFLDRELNIREQNKLPPFQRFISLILTGEDETKLEKEAFYFKYFIEKKIEGKVLGPVSAPIFRLKKKYRIRLLVRGSKSIKLQNSIAKIILDYKFSPGIKLSVDVDPINFN
jgi:primosomal protein N' (replication factor Y)